MSPFSYRHGSQIRSLTQKALFITNIPTPYRLPLLNVLNEELTNRGISFRVIFGALGYSRRQWRIDMSDCHFPYEVLKGGRIPASDTESVSFTYRGLLGVLEREEPGAILTNAFSVATSKLWLRSFVKETPYIIWSGAIHRADVSDSRARQLHRKLLVRRASAFVAYGSKARDYLVDFGATRQDISVGINTVDTAFFSKETEILRRQIQNAPTEKKRLLCIGHLVPRKGVDQLLMAIQLLATRRNDFILHVIGEGPERNNLEQLAQQLGIHHCVHFLGFKQKEEMPAHMAGAYCFVFPTNHDIWGLVLVEAMAAGLATLSSIHAGATTDLIQEGQTGFPVDFSRHEQVVERLDWLLDHPTECQLMGQRARSFVEQHATIKKSAEGFIAAIEQTLERQRAVNA
jgi:glycosyltransferase involved in cell wall biosynthesis